MDPNYAKARALATHVSDHVNGPTATACERREEAASQRIEHFSEHLFKFRVAFR
jgi:hypothetical protein